MTNYGYLYTPSGGKTRYATLVDSAGDTLAVWTHEHLPGPGPFDLDRRYLHGWNHVLWDQNAARLLAIVPLRGILALDSHSTIDWVYEGHCHHDLIQWPDGEGYLVLEESVRWIPESQSYILDNLITRISAAGKLVEKRSLWDLMARTPEAGRIVDLQNQRQAMHPESTSQALAAVSRRLTVEADSLECHAILRDAPGKCFDVLHCNSLDVFVDENGSHRILVSVREIDTVYEIDWEAGAISNNIRGGFRAQHSVRVLDSKSLLLLDNCGSPDTTRVIKLTSPGTEEVVYGDDPSTWFRCDAAGGVQPLDDGGILISDARSGRVWEIDEEGRERWEWNCPEVPIAGGRGHFYRVDRYSL